MDTYSRLVSHAGGLEVAFGICLHCSAVWLLGWYHMLLANLILGAWALNCMRGWK